MEKLFHRGQMRTKCDDCQFVCVTQSDYYRILHQVQIEKLQDSFFESNPITESPTSNSDHFYHQGEENQINHEDDEGKVVMVTERRTLHQVRSHSNIISYNT